MRILLLNRKIHSWGSIMIAIPLLVIILSGILLLLKKDIAWIQPITYTGKGTTPAVSLGDLFTAASQVEEADIKTWKDIKKIDVQPSKGLAKVIAKNRYEVQVDTETGKVLSVSYRRSDLIETLHDGTFFHDNAKYIVSLPSAIGLFILLVTGIVLFFQPYYSKRNKRRRKSQAKTPQSTSTLNLPS